MPFCGSLFVTNGLEGVTEGIAPQLAARLHQLTSL